jgi:hypothetical protein
VTDLRSVTLGNEALTSVNVPDGPILAGVKAAVEQMSWLTETDKAMVELAFAYAQRMDASDDAKTFGYLGQNLTPVLRALGGTPADRKSLGLSDAPKGALAALRAAR